MEAVSMLLSLVLVCTGAYAVLSKKAAIEAWSGFNIILAGLLTFAENLLGRFFPDIPFQNSAVYLLTIIAVLVITIIGYVKFKEEF